MYEVASEHNETEGKAQAQLGLRILIQLNRCKTALDVG